MSDIASELYVLDTSSLVWFRQTSGIPKAHWKAILTDLAELVNAGILLFPRQVLGELRRWHDRHDQLRAWAERCEKIATRHGEDFDAVREVLATVPDVLDANTTVEEADPYVLGLALSLARSGGRVAVVNEERKDRPDKRSITTACGELWLVSLPMRSLLARHGIWPV